jgi:Alr-MurF fusion protein
MISYSITEVASLLHAKILGNPLGEFQKIIIDSRTVSNPSTSLFVAIRGERNDGHNFVNELYLKGVRSFLVEEICFIVHPDASYILTENALHAFQKVVAFHRGKFHIPVIGITGSNGKTILKEWIYQSLHSKLNLVRSPKSYNSQVGVPLSVWLMEGTHQLAIFEAGISKPGEMELLEKIIQPTLGVITNIGEPHQENFHSLHEKCIQKMLLFQHCKTLIYCKDHILIDEIATSKTYQHLEKITWSRKQPSFLVLNSTEKKDNLSILQGKCKNENFNFELPFIDEASIENALHLITLLFYLGYDSKFIGERLHHLTPVAMRLELKHGTNLCTIINDSYNSDLGSLTIALDFLVNQRQHLIKTVILSDILQSGQTGEQLYTEVAHLLKSKNINKLIGIGTEISKFKTLFSRESEFYQTTEQFIKQLQLKQFNNEAILLKGSRKFEFEKVLSILEEKAHETVLEIDLNAFIHNLNYFRARLQPETKVIAMVKAFSYGSGSYEIANLLQFHRVDYLAVAFADEGVSLREAGITMPIMVMNPEKHSFAQIIKFNLEPELYSFRVFRDFRDEAASHGVFNYPVHIKIDTGMHRLGFIPQEIKTLINEVLVQDTLKVESVFSHLAGSDEEDLDYFTREQIETFEKNSSKIVHAMPYKTMRHILNSAGIERFASSQYDMVRLGIGLYGVSAIQGSLKQVSRLKTVILQIKDISVNETVGYGRKYIAKTPTRIGILPIGYADGIHRTLGNGAGKFYVNGNLAYIVGNICMDMCMIDLTGIKAEEGDEVIIFGEEYPIHELAKQMKTIPYEVLTSISRRVKRVYFQE